MSINLPSRRLLASANGLKPFANPTTLAYPLLPIIAPSRQPRRTIFNFLRKKREQPQGPTNPLTEEYLKSKPAAAANSLVRGDLAPSSIFESDDPTAPKPTTTSPTDTTAPRARDPASMAAALDPDPDARRRWQRKMVIRDIQGRLRLSKTEKIARTERQSVSKSHMLKTSVKKLGPLARQIAGKPIESAIVQMRFSKKLAAKEVKRHLEHAMNVAVARKGMGLGEVDGDGVGVKGQAPVEIELKGGKRRVVTDRTGIYVDQAWVGRGKYGREADHRARGQINVMRPPYTSITILLKEEATRIRQTMEREQKRQKKPVWVQLPNRPITAQRQYYSW